MSLQDILKKILDDAAAKVTKIEAETGKQKKSIAEEFTQKEEVELAELDKKTEKALATITEKTKSMARQESAKALLSAKQSLIQKALNTFLENLENASDELYSKILKKLFAKITADSGKVFAPSHRLEITRKQAPPGFDIVPFDKIKGGFILRSNTSEVDNSFKSLVFSEFKSEFTTYFAEQLKLV